MKPIHLLWLLPLFFGIGIYVGIQVVDSFLDWESWQLVETLTYKYAEDTNQTDKLLSRPDDFTYSEIDRANSMIMFCNKSISRPRII
jgi:hypothetical protein